MKKLLKKVIKWSVISILTYNILTLLILGHRNIDTKTMTYKFYWSGIDALWKVDESFGFQINKPIKTKFDGVDGPYVFNDKVYQITKKNEFIEQKLDSTKTITVKTTSKELPEFTVKLKDSIHIEKDEYTMPEKLIAISDIEGNFNGFYSFLLSNNVINKQANWTFGKGHLVLNGDFFDRGNQVTQVLWLIYHLEEQAEKQGGKVHFIIGNHEVMNLYGSIKYNHEKYIHVAKKISKLTNWYDAISYLHSQHSELGKWLRSKNIVEKIGDTIFVHGGLNRVHKEKNYSIHELNVIAKKYYGVVPWSKNIVNDRDKAVVGSKHSPYWDRRLNLDFKYKIAFLFKGRNLKETTQKELEGILTHFKVSKMVIGHTITNDISLGYDKKVIKIDVKHGREFKSGKTKGILIENDIVFKVNDAGGKQRLI